VILGWRQALGLAVALGALGLALRGRVGPWLREAAFLLLLFAVWQEGLNLFANHVTGAVAHGMWVWRAERWLHLPSERSVQRLVLHAPTVMRGLNFYYADVHVQDVMVCLAWVFWRHRDRYRVARNALVLTTLGSLIIQTVPVAPPRLLPATGVVDAGRLLGYAIYAPNGLHDPSSSPCRRCTWRGACGSRSP
jgi:uncharacterized membrane protein YbaN (DUF454 family)